MTQQHSLFSPSAAHRWLRCPGSLALAPVDTDGGKRTPTVYSAEGTVAHTLLEWQLRGETLPTAGTTVRQDGFKIDVTDEMLEHVRKVAGDITALTPNCASERRVNYSSSLGVASDRAFGTADASGGVDDEVHVHDLKYGRGEVVDAEENDQLRLYALGVLDELPDWPAERVRLWIHQPRVSSAPSEWACSVSELHEWASTVARPAARSAETAIQTYRPAPGREWEDAFLRPGAKQCRWCPAKASCPALARDVASTVSGGAVENVAADFEPIPPEPQAPTFGDVLAKLELIESWCAAQRDAARSTIQAGGDVPGWKLVEGRRGNRDWADRAAVESVLRKRLRLSLDEAYKRVLISPTDAEKLYKEERIGPRQWEALQAFVTRADGKPALVPSSDKRQALSFAPVVSEFTPVAAAEDDIT